MRKLFSLFAALTLSVGVWADQVAYRYPVYNEGGVTKGIKEWKNATADATEVTSATTAVTWGTAGQTTWFVVKGTDITISRAVTCAGDVRLILADGAKLTASSGIIVTGTNSLTIYAQSTGDEMGQLFANGGTTAAGIGGKANQSGNNITINGGKVTATGKSSAAGIGGGRYGNGSNITINGGIVTAKGGNYGAGIGGGQKGDGSDITINGGTVDATGGQYNAAGIGGGENGSGSNITINGGEVTTTGGSLGNAAGIGGGEKGSGSNITINGGKVTATGKSSAAGIGGGRYGNGSNITILAGTVTANGGDGGAGIGGGTGALEGGSGSGSNITILAGTVTANGGSNAAGIGGGENGSGSYITINGGIIAATGGEFAAGIGGGMGGSASDIFVATSLVIKAGSSPNPTNEIAATRTATTDITNDLAGKQYATIEPKPTPVPTTYLDENGETQNINAWEVKDASEAVTWGTADETTWYVVNGTNVQLAKGAICAGDVRLILADNAKLTATGVQDYSDFTLTPGIEVSGEGNSFIIYAQSTGEQMGQLVAQSDGASGIGGSFSSPNSFNIIINGGKVTATGLDAGIGGGQDGSGTNITINGGIVEATGGSGAGIGGGPSYQWDVNTFGSNITINGGTVTASSERGAGIGGGSQGYASNITINGGIVTTTGGEYSAGIGGSNGGGCINVVINGGTITAIGDESNPAIGGSEATISDIYISDAYNLYGGKNKDNTSLIPHSSAQDMADILSDWPQYYEYVRIEGLATPYTRTVTNGQWATVCLPYAATSFSGAIFYKLNYFDQVDKLYIEPVDNLVAGMPYIFQATATTVTIEHGDATLTYGDEQTEYGLHGSFARTIIESDGNLAALSSGTVMIAELAAKVTVPACRAYFDMTEVPTNEQPHSAPLRCIGVPRQTPTDLGQVEQGQKTMKVIENGQFRIVREGKTYNAQGIEL